MKDEKSAAVWRDMIVSLVFILLGIFAIVNINTGEKTRVAETATLSASTLPTIYGSLLILLAAAVFGGALRKLITGRCGPGPERVNVLSDKVESEVSPGTVMLRTLGTLVLLVTYALLLAYVNFILLTAGFLAALFILFGQRNPVRIGLASLLGGAGFYLLFIHFLNLPV